MTQEVNYLASNPLALALACLVLGLIVGSFLNVVIYRLPRMLESSWKAQCRDICELPAPDQPEPVLTLSTPASTSPTVVTASGPGKTSPLSVTCS